MNNQPGKEEFLELIQNNRGIIFKVCNAYCANISNREDLAQEIIYNLWKSLYNYDNRYNFSTWMYKVALNVAISFYRKQKNIAPIIPLAKDELEIEDKGVHDETETNSRLLQQFITELKPLDKALMLLYIDGKSYTEIAGALGISETNTATKINRIKNSLKQKALINK
jgi:RNA polymerase sigma factor (sigma-70 family)